MSWVIGTMKTMVDKKTGQPEIIRSTEDDDGWHKHGHTGPIWSPPVGLVGLVMFAGLLGIAIGVVTGRLLFKRVVRGRVLGWKDGL